MSTDSSCLFRKVRKERKDEGGKRVKGSEVDLRFVIRMKEMGKDEIHCNYVVLSFIRKLAYQLTTFPTTLLLVLIGALHGSPEFAKGILYARQGNAHSTHCFDFNRCPTKTHKQTRFNNEAV